jgi:hypothetical protein
MAKGEIFGGLPSWAKGTIAVAVVAAGAFVAYKLYKKAKDLAGNKDEKKVTNENLKEFDKLQTQGQKLSKPIPAYQQLVNDIVKKLNGCEDIRTEGQVIEGIIAIVKKPVDWYYLVSKFGNKDIEDCGTFGLAKTNYDLPTLLKDQLNTGGFLSINKDGFKRSGFYANSINLLNEYFKTIGVVI